MLQELRELMPLFYLIAGLALWVTPIFLVVVIFLIYLRWEKLYKRVDLFGRFLYPRVPHIKNFYPTFKMSYDSFAKKVLLIGHVCFGIVALIFLMSSWYDLIYYINSQKVYELATITGKLAFFLVAYLICLSILSNTFIVREVKRLGLRAKALEFYALCEVISNLLFFVVTGLLLIFLFRAFFRINELLFPLAIKIDSALALKENHITMMFQKSTGMLQLVISQFIAVIKPHLLIVVSFCFLGMFSPYFYTKGWKFSLALVIIFFASGLALKLGSSFLSSIFGNQPELLAIAAIVLGFFIFMTFQLVTDLLNPPEK